MEDDAVDLVSHFGIKGTKSSQGGLLYVFFQSIVIIVPVVVISIFAVIRRDKQDFQQALLGKHICTIFNWLYASLPDTPLSIRSCCHWLDFHPESLKK